MPWRRVPYVSFFARVLASMQPTATVLFQAAFYESDPLCFDSLHAIVDTEDRSTKV